MDKIKAAEVVLSGVKSVECPTCGGCGLVLLSDNGHSHTQTKTKTCLRCGGGKWIVNTEYVTACRKLGISFFVGDEQ